VKSAQLSTEKWCGEFHIKTEKCSCWYGSTSQFHLWSLLWRVTPVDSAHIRVRTFISKAILNLPPWFQSEIFLCLIHFSKIPSCSRWGGREPHVGVVRIAYELKILATQFDYLWEGKRVWGRNWIQHGVQWRFLLNTGFFKMQTKWLSASQKGLCAQRLFFIICIVTGGSRWTASSCTARRMSLVSLVILTRANTRRSLRYCSLLLSSSRSSFVWRSDANVDGRYMKLADRFIQISKIIVKFVNSCRLTVILFWEYAF